MFFKSAEPVFESGRENEMNVHLGFSAELPSDREARLVIAGSTTFTVFINGKFVHYGPARAARNMFRVENVPIGHLLTEEKNVLTVHLTTYNCNTYHYPMAPGFLQAEVIGRGDTVLAATKETGGVDCWRLSGLLQKVPRYSFQRGFSESYVLTPEKAAFDLDPKCAGYEKAVLKRQQDKIFLDRVIPLPDFDRVGDGTLISRGTVKKGSPDRSYRCREHVPSSSFFCYPMESCECIAMDDYLSLVRQDPAPCRESGPWKLRADTYGILSFSAEQTGLISLDLTVESDCELYLAFDEILQDGKLNAIRNGTCNVIKYRLSRGDYTLVTSEPYSLKYLELTAAGADICVRSAEIIRVGYPEVRTELLTTDPSEQKIFRAAVESFRQNTFDVFMDCPGRERAGWLCDSFFTARVEYALTGNSTVEKVFLENFLDAESFPFLPEGMLPMCYPADHTDGNFIPNWAMWYVLELREYLSRSQDRALIDRARPRVLSLIDYFEAYKNADGLLEKLDSWIFVEWSRANDLVRDVNYPTNALYAEMLDAASQLYGIKKYHEEADRIRAYIRSHAKIGMFYCDNSVRDEGTLRLSGECTEVCQYYMFYFGVATPASDPELWDALRNDFGPDRAEKGLFPKIHQANSFIGNYLRLDYLLNQGFSEQVLSEIKGYFSCMAETTGTLWEHTSPSASCNHGFASHVAVWLLKAHKT